MFFENFNRKKFFARILFPILIMRYPIKKTYPLRYYYIFIESFRIFVCISSHYCPEFLILN